MTHTINRLRFEVNCDEEDLAFNLRQNFAHTFQLQIASVIDRVCTQYVPNNEWIQIDKVEVDMGQLGHGVLANDFDKIFLYRFEKELVAKLSAIPAEKRKFSPSQSNLDLLKYFLQHGILPWWADEDTMELEAVCSDVFTNSGKEMEQFFMEQVNNVNVWQRTAFQFGFNVKKQIVQMLEPLASAKEILGKMLAALITSVNAFDHEQNAAILSRLQGQLGKTGDLVISNGPAIFAAGADQLQEKRAVAKILLRIFEAVPSDFELVKIVLNRVLGGILIGKPWFSKIQEGDKQELLIQSTAKTAGDHQEDKHNEAGLAGNSIELAYGEIIAELEIEKILVKGAGIILLAPFFIPFFTKLHLIMANQWVNPEARVKAIYLLSYLGTGSMQNKEYQLVLEKLLCGMTINEPLEPAPEFTKAETDEAEELLHSVLEHWKQLKNTSVNGLRESFFKRDGIITAKEGNWQLQVERKTMDVLLDSIPWGFSTISLPWNEYIIFTEW